MRLLLSDGRADLPVVRLELRFLVGLFFTHLCRRKNHLSLFNPAAVVKRLSFSVRRSVVALLSFIGTLFAQMAALWKTCRATVGGLSRPVGGARSFLTGKLTGKRCRQS